jgi:cardiolipin synthase
MKNFVLFSNPPEIYEEMLKDIDSAKNSVYLETYIYDDDSIGKKFKDTLLKKAKQGVKIKLLLDAWGSTVDKEYFKELMKLGAEVRFFREFKYVIRIFSKNHERNHRKLLLIDNEISYIGSLNIGSKFLKWRELVLKLEGDITSAFSKSFTKTWESYGDFNPKRMKSIVHKGFEIIHDFPSYVHRLTEKKYIKLINNAEKEIRIETPFFIPSLGIRNAFENAIKRGVKINVIIPYKSDIRIADLLRDSYLGKLHKAGVNIYYYKPENLHSKLLIVDNKFFLLGSSNLDYRSFIYQYEINFFGKNSQIIKSLNEYSKKTLLDSTLFDYNDWKKRSSFKKILELLMLLVRDFL